MNYFEQIPSHDGYLRISLQTLKELDLSHLISGLDNEDPLRPLTCGQTATISGYTEWIFAPIATLSVGWDWLLDAQDGRVSCLRVGLPRTNLMLVDETRNDLGWIRTLELLAATIDTFPWSNETHRALMDRYSL